MAAAAPAAPPLPTEPRVDLSTYTKLIDFLCEREHIAYDDLPKELKEMKSLHRAWIEGIVQFGRREWIETGEKSDNNAKTGVAQVYERMETGDMVVRDVQIAGSATRYIIEQGMSWSRRDVKYKTLPAMLAEKWEFKRGANFYEVGADGKPALITEDKARELLGYFVRLSNKALTALAA